VGRLRRRTEVGQPLLNPGAVRQDISEQAEGLSQFPGVAQRSENVGLVLLDAVGGALVEYAAPGGKVEEDAAAVVGVGAAVDEVVGDHAVDELGDWGK
jgi:hypothetical protein